MRGRKLVNLLWKKKRNFVKKSYEITKTCNQQVVLVIHDPKYNRITFFQSQPDEFNMEKLVEMQKHAVKMQTTPLEFSDAENSDSEKGDM